MRAMAEDAEHEALLRREYHAQTARIAWAELAPHFAAGSLIQVADHLDLVEVAVQLALDNVDSFQAWTGEGAVAPLTDAVAGELARNNASVWAVVAPPWVLVQTGPESPKPSQLSE